MVLQILFMSAALGAASFAIGMLPLSYTFSRSHLECLSILGTGLLLGAALGVIIPEGVETMSESNKASTGRMASCLVTGFILMVIVEQLVAPRAHSHTNDVTLPLHKTNIPHVEPATHIEDLSETESSRRGDLASVDDTSNIHRSTGSEKAFSLLLGLVIHAAADGLALGVANLARNKDGNPNPVSSIVFLALMLHKAPTSLAFTTSLLSTNLPRPTCKKYVAIFSASTPLSAILSYFIFQSLGSGGHNDLTGTALLISGGSFLYVATVLQPVSHHSHSPGDLRPISRVLLLVLGIISPLALSTLIDHRHQ